MDVVANCSCTAGHFAAHTFFDWFQLKDLALQMAWLMLLQSISTPTSVLVYQTLHLLLVCLLMPSSCLANMPVGFV